MFNVFEIIRIESRWQLRPELVRSSLVIGVNSVQAIWSALFWLTFPSAPTRVSLSSKDQAEMDPADMEDVEEVEEEETGEDENSKGTPPC